LGFLVLGGFGLSILIGFFVDGGYENWFDDSDRTDVEIFVPRERADPYGVIDDEKRIAYLEDFKYELEESYALYGSFPSADEIVYRADGVIEIRERFALSPIADWTSYECIETKSGEYGSTSFREIMVGEIPICYTPSEDQTDFELYTWLENGSVKYYINVFREITPPEVENEITEPELGFSPSGAPIFPVIEYPVFFDENPGGTATDGYEDRDAMRMSDILVIKQGIDAFFDSYCAYPSPENITVSIDGLY